MLGWAFIVFMIGGVALVARGMRGRRVDDHPVCAGCSFDLVGLLSADGPATTCPECGAPVAARRGVQWGRRRRQPWLIGAGAVMLATAAGLIATPKILQANRGTLIRNAPYWFIKKHALDTGNAGSREYQIEILRRMNEDVLDSEQLADVAINALALQPRVDAPMGYWGDLFHKADQSGVVTIPQRQSFLEGSFQLELVARSIVAVGDLMPFEVRSRWRGATLEHGFQPRFESYQSVRFTFEQLSLGTQTLRRPPPRVGSSGSDGAWISWGAAWALETPPATLTQVELVPGEYELGATVHVEWNTTGRWQPGAAAMASLGLSPQWTRSLRAPVRVVAAGSNTVETVADPALAGHYKSMIEPSPYIDGTEFGFSYGPGATGGFPEDAAFRVMTPVGDRREILGSLLCRKNGRYHSDSFAGDLVRRIMTKRPGEMRIILVPDPELAKQTTDMTRVYAGPEIIMTMPLR